MDVDSIIEKYIDEGFIKLDSDPLHWTMLLKCKDGKDIVVIVKANGKVDEMSMSCTHMDTTDMENDVVSAREHISIVVPVCKDENSKVACQYKMDSCVFYNDEYVVCKMDGRPLIDSETGHVYPNLEGTHPCVIHSTRSEKESS